MIQNSIKLISLFIFIGAVVILIGFYSQNKNLIKFNKIILKGNNHLSSVSFYKIIDYDIDNSESYNQETIDSFLSKIYDLKKYDIIQDLHIRVINIIGEELLDDVLQDYVGDYIKEVNLNDNAKCVYFLEIGTDQGVINKKLILQ